MKNQIHMQTADNNFGDSVYYDPGLGSWPRTVINYSSGSSVAFGTIPHQPGPTGPESQFSTGTGSAAKKKNSMVNYKQQVQYLSI
jgi:hypothetical protein